MYALHGCLLLIGDEVGARDLLNAMDGRFLDHAELRLSVHAQPMWRPKLNWLNLIRLSNDLVGAGLLASLELRR